MKNLYETKFKRTMQPMGTVNKNLTSLYMSTGQHFTVATMHYT